MYTPIKAPLAKFNLSRSQTKTLNDLATELKLIEKELPFIKEIVVRGGFVLDTLYDVPPKRH
jgi:hypothetical protein